MRTNIKPLATLEGLKSHYPTEIKKSDSFAACFIKMSSQCEAVLNYFEYFFVDIPEKYQNVSEFYDEIFVSEDVSTLIDVVIWIFYNMYIW